MDTLVGYISGATVDLARVSSLNGGPHLADQQSFVSAEFQNFETILRLYLKKTKLKFSQACFGVAGPVIGDEVKTTNLPWFIVGSQISNDFRLNQVKLVNDVVASAHGLQYLSRDKFFEINEGEHASRGNLGLIAAGSGLGQALIYYEADQMHPYPSEGGHADFAPGNQTEMELWEYIYAERGFVEVEDVVSSRGLVTIFDFVLDGRGSQTPNWYLKAEEKSGAIIEQAISGKDQDAIRALDIFIDCYASEAANLALKGMTLGGLFIGGVIAPQIVTAIDRSRFMERFIKKGKMSALLASIPVGIIIEEKTALFGAASLALSLQPR